MELLKDKDPKVRAAAAESLGLLGGSFPDAADAVFQVEKHDKDPEARRAAHDALLILWGK